VRFYFTILLFLTSSFVFGQTSFLKDAVAKLDNALVGKDTITLKQLLHKDVSYGHSNGWVQTKEDVIKDFVSGKLAYTKIDSKDLKWITAKDWASVRSSAAVKFIMDGKETELNLHVLQVWLKTSKGWQLIARQSTKL